MPLRGRRGRGAPPVHKASRCSSTWDIGRGRPTQGRVRFSLKKEMGYSSFFWLPECQFDLAAIGPPGPWLLGIPAFAWDRPALPGIARVTAALRPLSEMAGRG